MVNHILLHYTNVCEGRCSYMEKIKKNVLFLILFCQISILTLYISNYIYRMLKTANSGFFLGDVEETY